MEKGVKLSQLTRWGSCLDWEGFKAFLPAEALVTNPCEIFTEFRSYPQSLSLSVLVTMELLKAFSAVSLNTSMFKLPPWKNRWLLPGVLFPAICHLILLYTPTLSNIFGLVPLKWQDWKVIFNISNLFWILIFIILIFFTLLRSCSSFLFPF